jgi:pimeloyl-ACP methyl ester carboxylesterase
MRPGRRLIQVSLILLVVIAIVAAWLVPQLPAIGASALLFSPRRVTGRAMPAECIETTFQGEHGRLSGWHCRRAADDSRGTIVYLHGIADDRGSAQGVVQRFLPLGFDVVAYDSRAHGRSDGERCTYGYFEKHDLKRVIGALDERPVILIGHSLGAAVALQTAPLEPRIRAIVAASTYADLRSIATDRAPFVFTKGMIETAFEIVERDAQFKVDDVSPIRAAQSIDVPVFLIHGQFDRDTPPHHSRRVFDALPDVKRLLIVPGAAHNDVLRPEVWEHIERWIATVLSA